MLGGSFNPVHSGHLYLAETALRAFGYDRVIFVPAFVSPFKQIAAASGGAVGAAVAGAAVVCAADRLDMLLASVCAMPCFGVDETELERGGVSYTIDTVKDIIERCRPEGKLGLVIGDDLCADFAKWKSAEELASLCDIIVARRVAAGAAPFPYPHRSIQNDVMNISSAMLRERIAAGNEGKFPWRSLVPDGARRIIEERGLYGAGGGAAAGGGEPADKGAAGGIAVIEDAVRAMLKPSRFLHSRNTALMAWDLAGRFGLDPDAAYLAGISHDMGKYLDGAGLLETARRDGKAFSALEQKKPDLLHGRAAAVLLRERFGIHNREVLEAVALHTTAAAGMGPLAKAVFIADKIEYSRRKTDPALREMAAGNAAGGGMAALDKLFAAVLEDNIRFLRDEKLEIAEETLALYGTIQKGRDA
jgi:nicotinate-nucleotide adenylyltransferase